MSCNIAVHVSWIVDEQLLQPPVARGHGDGDRGRIRGQSGRPKEIRNRIGNPASTFAPGKDAFSHPDHLFVAFCVRNLGRKRVRLHFAVEGESRPRNPAQPKRGEKRGVREEGEFAGFRGEGQI